MAGSWFRLGRSATKAYNSTTAQQRIKISRPSARKAFLLNIVIFGGFYYFWLSKAQKVTRSPTQSPQPSVQTYSDAWKKQHKRLHEQAVTEAHDQASQIGQEQDDDDQQEEQQYEFDDQNGQGSDIDNERLPIQFNSDFAVFPPDHMEPVEFIKQLQESGSTSAAFIPLTWMKKLEPQPYSGNEPEWNEFTKLSNDKKAMEDVQNQLTSFCLSSITDKYPQITDVTGFPFENFNSWVDVTYPQMKPARYERTGVLWVANGAWKGKMLWARCRYDGQEAKRFSSLAWPDAWIKSFYAAATFTFEWYFYAFKNMVGLFDYDKNPPGQKSIAEVLSEAKAEHKKNKALDYDNMSGLERSARKLGEDLHLDLMADQSSRVFRTQFLEEWSRSRFALPLGVCRFSGHIGLHGPQGHCKIAVEAYYLPKEKVFYSISLSLANLWPYSQSPGRRYATDQFDDD